MHDLPHIAARLYGTPLLVARAKLDVILGVLEPRLSGRMAMPMPDDDDDPGIADVEVTADGIAIVPVMGTLVARTSYLGAASGLSSYAEIGEQIEAAATDPSIRAILLDVDSSGGEVGGLFDLVDQIQSIRAQCGKPIWAVADEAALSAAYAIACTADRLYVTQTGEVGSIGVVAAHRDESGADTQAGLAWTFIHAGACKVDGNPHQPLSDTARVALQTDVDGIYGRFVDLVAKCRKKTPDAIRPEALRRTVLEQLASRSDAADVIAAAPVPVHKPAAESPIVRRAREIAARQ